MKHAATQAATSCIVGPARSGTITNRYGAEPGLDCILWADSDLGLAPILDRAVDLKRESKMDRENSWFCQEDDVFVLVEVTRLCNLT